MTARCFFQFLRALLALGTMATAYTTNAGRLPHDFRPPHQYIGLPKPMTTGTRTCLDNLYYSQFYDLGLGRNPPVRQTRTQDEESQVIQRTTTNTATQYLVEHECVIEREKYIVPPPVFVGRITANEAPKRGSPATPVVGRRITDDAVLHILGVAVDDDDLSSGQAQSRSSIETGTKSGRQSVRRPFAQARGYELRSHYDLNTVWVEMLIHSQQHQHALCMAATTITVVPENFTQTKQRTVSTINK